MVNGHRSCSVDSCELTERRRRRRRRRRRGGRGTQRCNFWPATTLAIPMMPNDDNG